MATISIGFWNIDLNTDSNKPELLEVIACLCHENGLDILLLAEHAMLNQNSLLNLIYKYSGKKFIEPQPINSRTKVKIFYNPNALSIQRKLDDDRYSICACEIPSSNPILNERFLLVSCHLTSFATIGHDRDNQDAEIRDLTECINQYERTLICNKTVVVGDLNANPFDAPMVERKRLNALSCKALVRKNSKYKGHRTFYNPMWSHYFDPEENVVSGSYRFNASRNVLRHWNILDQVLVRSELLENFDESSLKIVRKVGNNNLRTRDLRKPNDKKYSDHFPITFQLKFFE